MLYNNNWLQTSNAEKKMISKNQFSSKPLKSATDKTKPGATIQKKN